jgi:hypothetical protein
MNFFRCDWCREEKDTVKLVIGSKTYDVCGTCNAFIFKKLDGCGEPTTHYWGFNSSAATPIPQEQVTFRVGTATAQCVDPSFATAVIDFPIKK